MILVSTDGSELSEKAIVTAAKLAKNLNTCVLGITVVKAKGSETAARTLDDVKDACQRVGVPCEVSEVVGTSIPDAILKVAQERDVRFIVMASRGLGTLGSLFIGSSTQQVLQGRQTGPCGTLKKEHLLKRLSGRFFYKGSFRICNYNPNLLNRNFCNGYETSKRYFSSGAL